MKTDDRYLIAIAAGILALVVAALTVVWLRPAADYLGTDDPEAVAHDYLLALQRENWERAHESLATSLACYPTTPDMFFDDLIDHRYDREFQNNTLRVESSTMQGDSAIVRVRETWFSTGTLFSSGQSSSEFEMVLSRDEGRWRVTQSDRYWPWYWSDPGSGGCAEPRRNISPRR